MTQRDGKGFAERWLRFDPQRPMRRRLLARFVMALCAMLLASACLAAWAS